MDRNDSRARAVTAALNSCRRDRRRECHRRFGHDLLFDRVAFAPLTIDIAIENR